MPPAGEHTLLTCLLFHFYFFLSIPFICFHSCSLPSSFSPRFFLGLILVPCFLPHFPPSFCFIPSFPPSFLPYFPLSSFPSSRSHFLPHFPPSSFHSSFPSLPSFHLSFLTSLFPYFLACFSTWFSCFLPCFFPVYFLSVSLPVFWILLHCVFHVSFCCLISLFPSLFLLGFFPE